MKQYSVKTANLLGGLLFIYACFASSETRYLFERLWPTLAQPWYFNSPAGLACDASGNVYIADSFNKRVQKFSAQGHFITMWNGTASGGAVFTMPQDVAVDLDGHVYVVDSLACTVRVFTPWGDEITAFGAPGGAAGQFNGPQGIAVDMLGRVYVADTQNHRIQYFDSAGTFLGLLGENADPPVTWTEPHDVCFDYAGNAYVADTGNHRILLLDAAGVHPREIGGPGSAPGLFNRPTRVIVDAAGTLYVSDQMNYRIQKFDSTGAYLLHWGVEGDAPGEFATLDGLAMDPYGHLLAADRGWHDRIQVFTDTGVFIAAWGSQRGGSNEFNAPRDIAVDADSRIYVADYGNARIQRLDADGHFEGFWGPSAGEPGHCLKPYALALNPARNLAYVYDINDGKIRQYDMAGVFLREWDSGAGEDIFGGIASAGDYLYLADSLHCRIRKFSHAGALEDEWGEFGFDTSQFMFPYDVGISNSGELYVADTYNNRIQVFDQEGAFLRAWGTPGSAPGELNFPVSIAFTQDASVLVSDSDNHRVQQFSPDGDFITEFGEFGAAPGQLNGPGGIAALGPDRVLVADTLNNRLQQFHAVDLATRAKAILVAGGGPITGNSLWDATRLCAHFAYHTLRYSGYTREDICLLSADRNVDLDNDGLTNDVMDDCTLAALEQAMTVWVDDAEMLVIYLVNHGGINTFRMNAEEILEADQFTNWLEIARGHVSGKVLVINDSCHSGSFVDVISGAALEPAPLVIAGAASEQSAYFLGTGAISFSNLFWTEMMNGHDASNAFQFAASTIQAIYTLQTPQLDGDGDGTVNTPADYDAAAHVYLNRAGGAEGRPAIHTVDVPESLSGADTVEITAGDITSDETLSQVWAVVRPPDIGPAVGGPPILSLPTVPLDPDGTSLYRGMYSDLSTAGDYQIAIYARDILGRTSQPVIRTLSVDNALRPRAILVTAASPDGPVWQAAIANSLLAYQALRFQGYSEEDILFYCSETISAGVDGLPTFTNLQYAITEWAAADTRDLVIYLTGVGDAETLQLGVAEVLPAGELKTWLDALQATLPGRVVLVADFCESGSLLSVLAGMPDGRRIVISGGGPESAPSFSDDGEISFSRFFWRQVLAGANLRGAFLNAANALRFADAVNAPQLDDTGDGKYTPGEDGREAAHAVLGRGIQVAADAPTISMVSPAQEIGGEKNAGETSAEIWVDQIAGTTPIDLVFALVFPPDHDPYDCSAIAPGGYVVPLSQEAPGRYSATYNGFDQRGTYHVLVYAVDENGVTSAPARTVIDQRSTTTLPDAYDPDDTPETASWIGVGGPPQRHNFSREGDEDWVLFFAAESQIIVVETRHLGPAAATRIELYRLDETTELLAWDEYSNPDEERAARLEWTAEADGFLLVRVTGIPLQAYGADAFYDLIVRDVVGLTIPGAIAVNVKSEKGTPLGGATVALSNFGTLSSITDAQGGTLFPTLPANWYTVTASRSGYYSASQSVNVYSGQTANVILVLQGIAREQAEVASEGEGEGEGEGEKEGEGEGESEGEIVDEGEGEIEGEGEGESVAEGEGEGEIEGEGEGETAIEEEGEGEFANDGEGEGEGEEPDNTCGCAGSKAAESGVPGFLGNLLVFFLAFGMLLMININPRT